MLPKELVFNRVTQQADGQTPPVPTLSQTDIQVVPIPQGLINNGVVKTPEPKKVHTMVAEGLKEGDLDAAKRTLEALQMANMDITLAPQGLNIGHGYTITETITNEIFQASTDTLVGGYQESDDKVMAWQTVPETDQAHLLETATVNNALAVRNQEITTYSVTSGATKVVIAGATQAEHQPLPTQQTSPDIALPEPNKQPELSQSQENLAAYSPYVASLFNKVK